MKNPLRKRFLRELKQDFGKYAVIFLFITLTIGFISGFLVADNSMTHAYDESFEKYNIEDGNFELEQKADAVLLKKVETENDVVLYENFYKEVPKAIANATLRIFGERNDINLVCVMEGRAPQKDGEIALDRLFAENRELKIGDSVVLGGEKLEIVGTVALSDYSAQFQNNSDMMFDATNFGVAIVTKGQYDKMDAGTEHFIYSWKNNKTDLTDSQQRDLSDDILKQLVSLRAGITNITPAVENQAIHFTGDDMGSDKSMIQVLLYVIMVILSFIFSVTIASIIEKEASEIGTMRALGFTRGELLRHYITLPVTVTLISCVLGNILGYTVFKDVMAGMYYHSYSLPTYITLWNPYAFVITTVVPCMIMIVVNTIVLYTKLKLSPLKFLRHDLNHWREKKAVRLPKVSFMARFRLRILIQNKVNYLVMFLGVTFASLLIFFGLLMTPLLDHYGMLVEENMISDYQYVLKMPVQTKNEAAEKYAVKSLILDKTDRKLKEEINVYGIREDSDYITGIELQKNGNGVYASEGILEKYKLSVGDTLVLKDEYSDDTYEFEILGTYPYPASFTVFISSSRFEELFDKEEGYFNGYFSNEELTDLDSKAVAATITYDDMTKVVRQLKDSMGQMFPLITVFSVFMAVLIFYLLSKIVVEKNATAISMLRILGYNKSETAKLYMMSTTIAAVISVLLSLGIAAVVMRVLYDYFMQELAGWLTYYVDPANYVWAVVLGLASYGVSAALQYRKIGKVGLEAALKRTDL